MQTVAGTSPVVSIIGAGQCGPELSALARKLGSMLAEKGFAVVCGGLQGVMLSVCQGARERGGLTIGILPGEDRSAANPFVGVPIATGLGHMRNYLVVLNGDIVCAVGGGFGTLSEIALARKIGRDVVTLGAWNTLEGVIPASDVADAVNQITSRIAKRHS